MKLTILSISAVLLSIFSTSSSILEEKEEPTHSSPFDLFLTNPLFSLIPQQKHGVINEKNEYTQKELECLARNLYFEARGEGEKGMTMVGHVTMNRVKSSRYPDTICGVVYQKSQFSWTRSKNQSINESNAYRKAKQIARKVANRDENKTHLEGAIYFHTKYVTPSWARYKKEVAVHRTHIFRK